MISIEQDNGYKANFVLATICDDELSQQKIYNKSAQNGKLQRGNLKQNASKQTAIRNFQNQKVTGNHSTARVNRPSNDNFGNSNTTINENEISPEIPVQDHRGVETSEYQPMEPSQSSSDYQGIRKIFFEPTQATADHTMVVLAPDSDDEKT